MIEAEIEQHGLQCSLNHFDVSSLQDFRSIFEQSLFNGDISLWNVGCGTKFSNMFKGSIFNGDISQWNTSHAVVMRGMFEDSKFKGDLSKWRLPHVVSTESMFEGSKFDGDITHWSLPKIFTMERMFNHCPFKGDLSNWKIFSFVQSSYMFDNTFVGVPPRIDCSITGPYAAYSDMFGSWQDVDRYLARTSLNSAHASIISHETLHTQPSWLNAERYQWFQGQKDLFAALNCTPEECYTLLMAAMQEKVSCPCAIEDMRIDTLL